MLLTIPDEIIYKITLPLDLPFLKLLSQTSKGLESLAKVTRHLQLSKISKIYNYLRFHAFPADVPSPWGDSRIIENMRGICPHMEEMGVYLFPPALPEHIEEDPTLENIHEIPYMIKQDVAYQLQPMYEAGERPLTDCTIMVRPEMQLTFVLGKYVWGISHADGACVRFRDIDSVDEMANSKMCVCQNVLTCIGAKRVHYLNLRTGIWNDSTHLPVELGLTTSNYMILDMKESVLILSEIPAPCAPALQMTRYAASFTNQIPTTLKQVRQLGKVPSSDILGFQAMRWKQDNTMVFLPPQDDWARGMYTLTVSEAYGVYYGYWSHHHFAKNIQTIHEVSPAFEGVQSVIWDSHDDISIIIKGVGMWTVTEKPTATKVQYRVRQRS